MVQRLPSVGTFLLGYTFGSPDGPHALGRGRGTGTNRRRGSNLDMAGIGALDTLASVWGERLSAREQLPAAHKEAYANHAKLAAARAEGDAARLLLADAVGNHDYMDALLADVDGRVSNRPTMTTARSNTTTGTFEAGSSRCGANWPARLRSSASLSAITVRHTLRPICTRAGRCDGVASRSHEYEQGHGPVLRAAHCATEDTCFALVAARASRRSQWERQGPLENEWWRTEGPHCHNLFKWNAVQARAQVVECVSDLEAAWQLEDRMSGCGAWSAAAVGCALCLPCAVA